MLEGVPSADAIDYMTFIFIAFSWYERYQFAFYRLVVTKFNTGMLKS